MKYFIQNVAGCLIYLIIVLLCLSVVPFIFMLLWNEIVPLFWATAPILTFWQAVGVIILISIIGKAFKYTTDNG